MRIQFLIFPIMVLLVVIYIYYRIWHILPVSHFSKWHITIVLILPVALFFGYMSYRSENSSYWFNQIVSIVSTSWMIILLYLFMTFLVIDILPVPISSSPKSPSPPLSSNDCTNPGLPGFNGARGFFLPRGLLWARFYPQASRC